MAISAIEVSRLQQINCDNWQLANVNYQKDSYICLLGLFQVGVYRGLELPY